MSGTVSTSTEPLLKVTGLTKHYPIRRGVLGRAKGEVRAATDVSLELGRGETLALVGESGCGKTTVGRTIMQFETPTSGSVVFDGQELTTMSPGDLRRVRQDIQYVFQDPFTSLNPRMRVDEIVAEPLEIHGVGRERRRSRVSELLELVGLPTELASRYPRQLSGGQRQRVGIARALALEPKLLILDEPVSALDVSVQAQVINLLTALQAELGLSYLFIAHDLAVVRHLSHRVAVMYLGRIVELGIASEVLTDPAHPYTAGLLAAVPAHDPRLVRHREPLILGELPSPTDLPSGCSFRTRCWRADELCADVVPELRRTSGTEAACHHPLEPNPALFEGAHRQ